MSFYLMHRGWMDNPIFSNEPFTEKLAWLWMIQEASFEPHKVRYHSRMIEVSRGQIPTSYRTLKKVFQWGNERIRRFLNLLVSESMILLETGTGFLIITICNYEKYQKPVKITGTQPGTLVGTDSGTQPGTNIKKRKNLNKEYTSDFEIFWKAYPRKDGSKADAFISYEQSLTTGVTHEALIRSVEAFAAFNRAEDTATKHIAHAATWLNKRRWESEYAIIPTSIQKPKETRSQMMVV